MKEITIICKPDGTVELRASGFRGSACFDASKVFEQDAEITECVRTQEYYLPEEAHSGVTLKNGRK